MRLIDTHAHIYLDQFDKDIDEVIDRAKAVGIDKIYMPNIDHTSIDSMLRLAELYPEYCIPMMGLHPCSVDKNFEKELYIVEDWLNNQQFAAVGEIGTDLYWDKTFWPQQQEALKIQIELAKKHDLPFAIHCRDSIDETISLIEDLNTPELKGVFHCFTGSLEQANKITGMNYMLGIGGVATFKNGGLEEVISGVDLERIVLETDSPYLAPAPNRGKRNEPSYVLNVCEKIAQVRNSDVDNIAEVTSLNANKLFNTDVN